MDDTQRAARTALGLMRMALAHLHKPIDQSAISDLERAIGTLVRLHQIDPGDELEAETACLLAGIPLSGP